jgi:hypothetical protein
MKHVFFIISTISCLLISGCQDDRLQLPKAQSIPKQLNLTSDLPTGQLILAVTGTIDIRWSLTYKPDWINIVPTAGSVGNGSINVTALTSTLLPQTLSDKIVITTATGKIEIPVTLTITTSTAVQLVSFPLYIDYHENSRQFTIINSSSQPASWQITPSATYLGVTPASGILNAGQSSVLTLTINRSGLETKNYSEKLALKLGDVHNADYYVTISSFRENKWIFDGVVADAEYDRTGDNLIVIIDNKLYKLQPEARTAASVTLSQPGSCVSVSKGGQYAVVGHESSISLVDLTAMKIDKTYPTSTDVLDVVLAPNNWVYVFPKGYGWTNIRCINLLDGMEVPSTGAQIYAGTKAKLHPSGDYIYGFRNGLSPNDSEKYDIRSGQANYLYDSPYHGEHEFGDEPWISEDGLRMFTREAGVFNLSTDQSQDMIYSRTLEIENNLWIQAMDHTMSKNRLCAVYFDYYVEPDQCKVKVFSGDLLNELAIIPLPGFLVGQPGNYQIVPSEGIYGFFNSGGTKFYVVVRSRAFSSEAHWAVATINVD